MNWDLPVSVAVGGRSYHVNADYRDVLEMIACLNDYEQEEQTRLYVSLALFYDAFEEIPESDYGEAIRQMFRFINCGEEETAARPAPKSIDWEQDQGMIVADINRVAGCEVRALPFCHWWTFISWFMGIGDGQLSTVVSIREKRRKGKKLSDWEREFYRENREKVDFKKKYTTEEEAWLKKLLESR